MKTLNDRVVVITGAASGIGRALACQLAGEGAAVAISDTDADGLRATAAMVRAADGRVLDAVVDVSDVAAVRAHAEAVRAEFGVVHQLYNNAGIAVIGRIEDQSYDDLRRVMDVNFWGVVHGTKEFLPELIASGDGHIVNISSVFGIIAPPRLAGYDAAKFAVRGFTEALRGELLASKHPVGVTVVHPGGMRTAFVEHTDAASGEDLPTIQKVFPFIAVTTPDGAARAILRAVRHRKPRLLIGPDARAADLAQRLTGARYQRVAALSSRWFVPSPNK